MVKKPIREQVVEDFQKLKESQEIKAYLKAEYPK